MAERKIYGICVLKNEDDIIAETLTYATRYCDQVFVLDNGSTDETWQVVQAVASRNGAVVPFGRTDEPFERGLRANIYNALRGQLSQRDWWLVLDADEFLAEDPRPIIDGADAAGADNISTWQIQFYFTELDLQLWEQGRDTRDKSIFERRRHYLIDWQEPRLFRNDPRRDWEPNSPTFPHWLRRLHTRRILNRHYQYRDPPQIDKRLRLRYGHDECFSHVRTLEWRNEVRSARELTVLKDGDPWHFSHRGLFHFYRRSTYSRISAALQGGAMNRLRRMWKGESPELN